MKNAIFRWIAISAFGLFLAMVPSSLMAQNAPVVLPKPCPYKYAYLEKDERYRCFVEKHNNDIEAAANKTENPKPPSYFRQRLNRERERNTRRRDLEKQIIKQRSELSKSRNVTNKGKKYRVTFGRVQVPDDRSP